MAALEETPEGLAAAAATRQAVKQSHAAAATVDPSAPPPAKKKAAATAVARPPPTLVHDVLTPPGYHDATAEEGLDPAVHGTLRAPKYAGPPAKTYPFTLDPFQATSIAAVERRESVLVAAHTSAGKTAVAEYAIAAALRDGGRVIYTSPLKALSNQKYRELAEEFSDVGLLTGDVSVAPSARVLVMTTEILRAMLYRGSEPLRETLWIIFDEVHYMQDRERGVVWEEAIIFLPKGARAVFLSATLANAAEFAGWVAKLRSAPCHVVYTDYRPTPLQHYAYPLGGKGLYLVCDERGSFHADTFARLRKDAFGIDEAPDTAAAAVPDDAVLAPDNKAATVGARGGRGGASDGKAAASLADAVAKLVRLVRDRDLAPAIVFSFSRKACESYAAKLARGRDALKFTDEGEAAAIGEVFDRAVSLLSPDDASLAAVVAMRPLLCAGIGVHHSGLLPLLKEVTELLFGEGLVRVLCATETFAMGLNMPARTCIFTELRKWDGECHRWVSSGEYIQMSGRAGRRGTDDRGVCVCVVDDAVTPAVAAAMMRGAPKPLLSSFRLSYYTLLNLARRAGGGGGGGGEAAEYVVSRSFRQYQIEAARPGVAARLAALEAALAPGGDGDAPTTTPAAETAAATARRTLRSALLRADRLDRVLRPGRLVRVVDGGEDWGWGVVVGVTRGAAVAAAPAAATPAGDDGSTSTVVDVLLPCAPDSVAPGATPRPAPSGRASGDIQCVPVPLPLVRSMSRLCVGVPTDVRPRAARAAVGATLDQLASAHPDGELPPLDPVADLGDADPGLADAAAAPARTALSPAAAAAAARARADMEAEAASLRASLAATALDAYRAEAGARGRVLVAVGAIDGTGALTPKGRAAAEIDAADELLAAELMFNGVFGGLDGPRLAALVACLVPCEPSTATVELAATLAAPLTALQATARRLADIAVQCGVPGIDGDAYVASFAPTLMDAVAAWTAGCTFADAVDRTDLFEGSFIRAVRRLDEVLAQLAAAADAVGDERLAGRFRGASGLIRRGIVFAASLYV